MDDTEFMPSRIHSSTSVDRTTQELQTVQQVNRRQALATLGTLTAGAMSPDFAFSQTKDPQPLQVRYYSSVCPSSPSSQLQAFTQPLVDQISKRVNYPANVDHHAGSTPDDLLELGEQIDDGRIHLAAVWGIEYGWLKERFPRLELLVAADAGADPASKLLVRKDSGFRELWDLKGKIAATFKQQPLMERLFLVSMLQHIGTTPTSFFAKQLKYPTARDVVWEVYKQFADCCVINSFMLIRLFQNQPVLNRNLLSIHTSELYPLPVVIGRRDHVESIRTQLWNDIINELVEIHKTRAGKITVNLWRITRFIRIPQDYSNTIASIAKKYPLELLERIESGNKDKD